MELRWLRWARRQWPPEVVSFGGSDPPARAGGSAVSDGWRRGIVTVLVTVLLAGSLAGPAAVPSPVGTASAASDIELTQTFERLPDDPGVVRVTVRFGIPDRVQSLSTEVPTDATVVSTTEFEQSRGRFYEWSGDASPASITYRLPINRTAQARLSGTPETARSTHSPTNAELTGMPPTAGNAAGPNAAGSNAADESDLSAGSSAGYVFVGVGEWALLRRPQVPIKYSSYSPEPGVSRSLVAEGPGATGEEIVFLGESRTRTHTGNGQQFRLVIPASASLRESPEEILSGLEGASRALSVGRRDETVFVVAAPASVDWAVRGLQTGDADLWVRADEELNSTSSAWFHEYVHSRQDYRDRQVATGARWITEAAATYYANLIALETERVSLRQFRRFLEVGETYESAVLADPTTWGRDANYYKGALVAGELDRRIRLASDGERTLQDVIRDVNRKDGTIDRQLLLSSLATHGNESVRDAGERYTETEATPEVWSRDQHSEAFGPTPARVEYGFASPAAEIAGPYRTATVEAGTSVTLVTGERLAVTASAENVGGTETSYNASVWLDDRLLDSRTGRIAPGENETFRTNHTFEETGTYELHSGSDSVTVTVRRPPSPDVTGLDANRTAVTAGEAVRLVATVRNDGSLPAVGTLAFQRDGENLTTREVALAPGSTDETAVDVVLSSPGTYDLGLAGSDRSVTVSVDPATTPAEGTPTATPAAGTPTPGDDADSDLPTSVPAHGFGVGAALLGLLGSLVLASVRSKR